MGDSSDSDRPLKRVKYAQQGELHHEPQRVVTLPVTLNPGTLMPIDGFSESIEPPIFGNPWTLPPNVSPPSQMLMTLTAENATASWVSAPSASQSMILDHDLSPTTAAASFHNSPDQSYSQPSRLPRLLPAIHSSIPEAASEPQESSTRKSELKIRLISPFTDNRDRLGESSGPRFARPVSGQVNGYVKFNWPDRRPSIRSSVPEGPPRVGLDDRRVEVIQIQTPIRIPSGTMIGPLPAQPRNGALSPVGPDFSWSCASSPSSAFSTPISLQEPSMELISRNEPQMLPPQFGSQAKMDIMDRRLWDFYIKNWCPGRSVLSDTNLWLKDFARFQEEEGIRCAIQSLAGVYIYDYLPDERIRQRINNRYLTADTHFRRLLADPQSAEPGMASEVVITMAVILSMQDIVLTEGRRKKPHNPRWLEGFKQGEYFLHMTDPGHRFWNRINTQVDSLRLSQSIIVGRAVILAQPMMALPNAATLDPQQESSRFGWLLYGSEEEMFEIHGGCGFSIKLLHTMGQITYLAARMMQNPKSSVTPITARYIHQELLDMRQWSRESTPWNQQGEPTIDRIKAKPGNYVINNDSEMTDVTAEAWRFAAIIYLQCRVSRLPRNHPDVLDNLSNLAQCIRIMPTSGSHFTAQAPLLPVFFLGLLATLPEHKKVSKDWFEDVVRTPVRSSVPPLYLALKRIWTWIDAVIEVPHQPTTISDILGKRRPWWEDLVLAVHEKEEETLCLT